MPEKVKGHFRKGIWIGGYLREPKDRSARNEGAVSEKHVDAKWHKEYHQCCDGIICCICEEKLGLDAVEPVGHGLEKWHKFCGGCLWQQSGVQSSAVAKRQGCGARTPSGSASGVEKCLALLGMPNDFLESTDGE